MKALENGTKEANEAADKVLFRIKDAMGINYFNKEFLDEQIKKYTEGNE